MLSSVWAHALRQGLSCHVRTLQSGCTQAQTNTAGADSTLARDPETHPLLAEGLERLRTADDGTQSQRECHVISQKLLK